MLYLLKDNPNVTIKTPGEVRASRDQLHLKRGRSVYGGVKIQMSAEELKRKQMREKMA